MSTQVTDIQPNDQTLTEHRTAFEALAELARMFPALPAPYVTIDTPRYGPVNVVLTLRSAAAFEEWRVALQVPPADVDLCSFPGMVWLASNGVFAGVEIHFTGHNVALTAEQLAEPRDLAVPAVMPLHQAPAAEAVNA